MSLADPPEPSGVVTVIHPTPIGELTLAATSDALVYCAFEPPEALAPRLARTLTVAAEATPRQRVVLDSARSQLDAYLAGRRRAFRLPLDLRLASEFVRRTVTALDSAVPYGSTAAYGELARALGRPGAARAVGTALGANPLCVVLPCHRIVGAGGRPGGYAGGPAAKSFLLDLEKAA
ncbi:methylated-DNA--[protein]-cysteine S-methyltransferase [Streptomyces noursei]|uniref:methylated-DNA--[protein]-cysteine S-methyltransferase n=1 Tax=Streptomyces noursei TaxID=1971 RepID=UPI001679CF72|nr:methylated-DNA--[protein]-cysteine S-methyltransferase [Streptomyces noursei]MCZ1018715.1 methylated-DNA--[protein]-cysteine S-methyltransferase [Streptomyces noursei]GGX26791.1 methylated-DNA--protein-cysteine methyltransferase [Streptomyces noursei]